MISVVYIPSFCHLKCQRQSTLICYLCATLNRQMTHFSFSFYIIMLHNNHLNKFYKDWTFMIPNCVASFDFMINSSSCLRKDLSVSYYSYYCIYLCHCQNCDPISKTIYVYIPRKRTGSLQNSCRSSYSGQPQKEINKIGGGKAGG